jgi:predicted CoA-binding protein
VVGASSKPNRASHFVLTYLRSNSTDYEVWPVTPNDDEILGLKTYPSLADLPGEPDIVDVLPPPDDLPGVAEEAIEAARARAGSSSGCTATRRCGSRTRPSWTWSPYRCVKIEHARFHGGLHLAGFDTGVISSKRTRD